MGRAFIRNRLCVYRCFIRRGRVVLILIGIKMGYIMKKILCFIGILVGCQLGVIRRVLHSLKSAKQMPIDSKVEVNFAKWSGKNEPVRVAPVLLNLLRFPTITDKSPSARKSLAREDRSRPNAGRVTLRHQYILSDRQKKNRLEINLFIAPSSAEAHEYLIWRFVANSLPHEMRVNGQHQLGSCGLVTSVLQMGTKMKIGLEVYVLFATISWLRLVVEGEKFEREARGLAETVDYLLLKEKTGEDATAYYNREFQRLKENRRRGIIEKITREGP